MGRSIGSILGEAWQRFFEQVLWVLPHVLASLVVLALGVLLALLVQRFANSLRLASRIDRRLARIGLSSALESIGIRSSVAAIAGALKWSIVLVAAMLALYSLDARLASDLAERFFLYLPHALVGLAILAFGGLAAKFLGRSVLIAAVNGEIPGARILAAATRAGVMLLAVAVAFEHLGIGRATLLTAFAILFGGATLAAALAIGLGLQDVVRRWAAARLPDPGSTPSEQSHEPIQHW
jgi:hypothetical protein